MKVTPAPIRSRPPLRSHCASPADRRTARKRPSSEPSACARRWSHTNSRGRCTWRLRKPTPSSALCSRSTSSQKIRSSGVRGKLAGEVKLNEETGQVTTTLINTLQAPFEDFELELYGGPRAATATPPLCGGYATSATFTPWSGEQPLTRLSVPEEFSVTSGVGGGTCPATQPFAPSFLAGSTSWLAGAFAPFTLQITRPDGKTD